MGVDSGLFSYQRVIANAISPSPHPSGGLISVMLAVSGCRVRLGGLRIHRSKACHWSACVHTGDSGGRDTYTPGQCPVFSTPAEHSAAPSPPQPRGKPHRDEDPGLEELTDLGMGHKPNRAHWAVPSFDQ